MANVEYRIRGKDESQSAVKSAVGGLTSMEKAADRLGKVFKIAFSAVAIKKVVDAIQDVTRAFSEQQQAEIRLAAAARNNPLINGDAIQGLKEYASALQRSTTFGDEAIIQQQAFLTTLGLSEQQIRDVMRAAVDLASTGMVSLESAVRNISKTYGGMTGELGELIPALKNLTVEELKAGEAVQFIKDQYAGMGEAVAQSVEGQVTQLKNSFGDLKEAFGQTITNLAGNFNSVLGPVLEGFTKWIQDNQLQIVNFFRNFPEIAATTLNAIWEGIKRTFDPGNLKMLAGALWEYFVGYAKAAIDFIYKYLKAWGTTIWEPLKYGFEWIIYGIKLAWRAMVDFMVDAVNVILSPINAAFQGIINLLNSIIAKRNQMMDLLPGKQKEWGMISGAEIQVGSGYRARREDLVKPAWADAGEKILAAWKDAGMSVVDLFKQQFTGLKGIGEALWKPFKNAWSEYIPQFKRILQEPGPLLSDAASKMAEAAGGMTVAGAKMEEVYQMWRDKPPSLWEMQDPGLTDAYSGGVDGGPLASLFGELGPIIDIFGQMFTSLSSVQAILDPVSVILGALFDTIAPILNEVLKPIIGIFVILGKTLGMILIPVIQALTPVIEWLADRFIRFYNWAIVPVGNFLYKLGVMIQNIVSWLAYFAKSIDVWVYNLFHRKAKEKPMPEKPTWTKWSDVEGPLSAIDMADLYAAGDQYETGAGGGAGASYTSGRNVTVNVQINTDVIVGDRREMAIWIAEEIKAAEELGII